MNVRGGLKAKQIYANCELSRGFLTGEPTAITSPLWNFLTRGKILSEISRALNKNMN